MEILGLRNARKGGCYLKKFVESLPDTNGWKNVVPIDPDYKHRKMFYAIITNLNISGYFRVFGAKKISPNTWEVILYDGSTFQIEEEPENVRKVSRAYLVRHDRSLGFLNVIRGKFEDAINRLQKERWHLNWEDDEGQSYSTSALVKLWKDENGKKHAITESGSHYVF